MKRRFLPMGIIVISVIVLGVSIAVASRGNIMSNTAPSYQEIMRAIDQITKRDIDPKAPEVGPDGLVDPEITKAMNSYEDSLIGKRVEGWQGWYNGYTEIEYNTYNVSILMEKPEPGRRAYTDVLIQEVPASEGSKLKSWEQGQPVVFSGTISGMWWDGQVYLNYSKIDAAEK